MWIKSHPLSPADIFQTHPSLFHIHSHCLCVSAADVCLCQVPVRLRSGQEEAFLPAAATLPGKQAGSGFFPEQDDQSHLQTFTEETVCEERRP